MLSDAISLGIALLAFTFGARAANRSKTFGYKRFEILAAVLNGLTLIGIALFIFYEAIDRFANPPVVSSNGMLIIATIGLVVIILVALLIIRIWILEVNLNDRWDYIEFVNE